MKIKVALKSLLSAGLVAGIVALASPARAQSNPPAASAEMPYKAELVRCIENADNNAAFSICYNKAIDDAWLELGKRNNAIFAWFKGDKGTTKAFSQEVVSWEIYQDAACEYYDQQPFFGSDHRAILGPRCTLKVIEDRIELLDNQIANRDYE